MDQVDPLDKHFQPGFSNFRTGNNRFIFSKFAARKPINNEHERCFGTQCNATKRIYLRFFSRITLGNQLDGIRLVDPELINQFRKRYPDGNCMAPSQKATSA